MKDVIKDFLVRQKGDRSLGRSGDLIGLVSFAKYADINAPLVTQYHGLTQLVESLQMAEDDEGMNTSIGDAVYLAALKLVGSDVIIAKQMGVSEGTIDIASKVVILLTDGENNFGKHSPEEAAAVAAKHSIKIYPILIEQPDGWQQQLGAFGASQFMMRGGGEVNSASLKSMAEVTDGEFFTATDENALVKVYERIDQLESFDTSDSYMQYEEMYMPLIWLSLLLLLLDIGLSNTIFRRVP